MAAVLSLLTGLMPAGAIPDPIPGPLAPGWFGTDNVELHATIPVNADSAGARVVDDHLYVTDDRGLSIYDIADPLNPTLQGFTLKTQEPYVPEEDVDSNGEVVLIGSLGTLEVFDVTDPTAPTSVGTVPVDEHTVTCVLDCTYAYGSSGFVVDVTNLVEVGDWTDVTQAHGVTSSHDVTEIAPGIILTSSNPMLLLDARTDPARPTVIGKGTFPDERFVHGNLWPYHGDAPLDAGYDFAPTDFDDFVLVGGETSSFTPCGEDDGAFMTFTWDQPNLADGDEFIEFSFVDEYRVTETFYLDGGSPYDQFCAHWFTTAPDFHNGGNLAMAWYEHGTRFLTVEPDGTITDELGWIIPFGSSQSAAYWVTDEVVYTTDYQRGVDVLIVDTDPETTPQAEEVPGATFVRSRAAIPALVREAYQTRYGCPLPV